MLHGLDAGHERSFRRIVRSPQEMGMGQQQLQCRHAHGRGLPLVREGLFQELGRSLRLRIEQHLTF